MRKRNNRQILTVIWRADMIALVLAPSHSNNMTISLCSYSHCKRNNNHEEESIVLKFLKEMTNVKGQEVFPIQQNVHRTKEIKLAIFKVVQSHLKYLNLVIMRFNVS